MIRGMLLHIVLALGAVAAAYAAWQAPQATRSAAEVKLVDAAPTDLHKVRWQEGKSVVEVSRGEGGYDVAIEELADGGDQQPATAQHYPGSDRVEVLWKGLAPLWAARSLGRVADAQLAELGLATPTGELRLFFDGQELKLDIGGSVFGTGDLYARTADRNVVLMRASTVRDLRNGASSLIDRRLVATARSDVRRIVISSGDRTRELVQRHAHADSEAFFADPAEPDAKLTQATSWFTRLVRLRAVEETTSVPTKPAAVVVELWDTQQRLDEIKLWPPEAETGVAASARFPKGVTLSNASVEPLLRDLEAVLKEGR